MGDKVFGVFSAGTCAGVMLVLLILTLAEHCSRGAKWAECYPNGTCDEKLRCVETKCVP